MNQQIKQYQVVWVSLPRLTDHFSCQSGIRPCVVISNNQCNKHSPVITVVPITSKRKRNLPTHYTLTEEEMREANLIQESTVLGEAITSINKCCIKAIAGTLSTSAIQKVNYAVSQQLKVSC